MPASCCGKFKVTGKAINRGKGGALETPIMFIKMVHRSTKHKRKNNKDLTETVQENLK